ncbi:hypothetical protein Q1W73_00110 [Asticcacaulis sp. ZE23SCel15]|uniref:hypothetical protein n=1 Tax=Asticcacaulis sp. ZE23SCel15 TaxID=3059027 RepID=UPI00265DE426|nr:hypothetical protein [Asticcacaulis sp. ZE23SCel15]WKL57427.1 hypothetical protein Q1W73_00110 [Asticcacaulis sp. ZE23SCel15]
MVTSLIGAMVLHGCVWFFARLLAVGGGDAALEAPRQVGLAFFWMVGALAIWSVKAPSSRITAALTVLICAGMTGVLGSVLVFLQLLLHMTAPLEKHGPVMFVGMSLLMILTQVLIAIPAAITLQQIALKRRIIPMTARDA